MPVAFERTYTVSGPNGTGPARDIQLGKPRLVNWARLEAKEMFPAGRGHVVRGRLALRLGGCSGAAHLELEAGESQERGGAGQGCCAGRGWKCQGDVCRRGILWRRVSRRMSWRCGDAAGGAVGRSRCGSRAVGV